MRKYTSISGYLERYVIFSFHRLKIRLHNILSHDQTPYLHNHPFSYISIVLCGWYVEYVLIGDKLVRKVHLPGSIIFRSAKTYHRIHNAKKCKTLFFAFDSNNVWDLIPHKDLVNNTFKKPNTNGVYKRVINGKELFCKFDQYWYIGHGTEFEAIKERRLSIYQADSGNNLQ